MRSARGRRSRLRRRSSPAGIDERLALRIRGYYETPDVVRAGFRKPGSRNPRKMR